MRSWSPRKTAKSPTRLRPQSPSSPALAGDVLAQLLVGTRPHPPRRLRPVDRVDRLRRQPAPSNASSSTLVAQPARSTRPPPPAPSNALNDAARLRKILKPTGDTRPARHAPRRACRLAPASPPTPLVGAWKLQAALAPTLVARRESARRPRRAADRYRRLHLAPRTRRTRRVHHRTSPKLARQRRPRPLIRREAVRRPRLAPISRTPLPPTS